MAQVTLQRCVKVKLSPNDKAVLRRLIVDEICLYRMEGWGSEELITRIEKQAVEFIESCTLEAVIGEREQCLSSDGS